MNIVQYLHVILKIFYLIEHILLNAPWFVQVHPLVELAPRCTFDAPWMHLRCTLHSSKLCSRVFWMHLAQFKTML